VGKNGRLEKGSGRSRKLERARFSREITATIWNQSSSKVLTNLIIAIRGYLSELKNLSSSLSQQKLPLFPAKISGIN